MKVSKNQWIIHDVFAIFTSCVPALCQAVEWLARQLKVIRIAWSTETQIQLAVEIKSETNCRQSFREAQGPKADPAPQQQKLSKRSKAMIRWHVQCLHRHAHSQLITVPKYIRCDRSSATFADVVWHMKQCVRVCLANSNFLVHE